MKQCLEFNDIDLLLRFFLGGEGGRITCLGYLRWLLKQVRTLLLSVILLVLSICSCPQKLNSWLLQEKHWRCERFSKFCTTRAIRFLCILVRTAVLSIKIDFSQKMWYTRISCIHLGFYILVVTFFCGLSGLSVFLIETARYCHKWSFIFMWVVSYPC